MFRKKLVTEILSYDPLVSDTACQNRAIALMALSRKVSKGKALSSEEIVFLDDCALLSLTKEVEKDGFGLIEKETTDIKKIPESYFPGVEKITNHMRNELLAVTKKRTAAFALQIIRRKCTLQSDDTFGFYEKANAVIKLHSEAIPILPVYMTAKYLLQYINKREIPVLIKLTRLRINNETSEKVKLGAALFCYKNGRIVPANVEVLQGRPEEGVIIFDLLSVIDTKVRKQAKLFTEEGFDDFCRSFISQDFNLLIMLCAAAHVAYQKTIVYPDNDPLLNPVVPDCNLGAGGVSLKACTMREYRSLVGTASQYGFFKKRLSIDHISTTTMENCRQLIKEPA